MCSRKIFKSLALSLGFFMVLFLFIIPDSGGAAGTAPWRFKRIQMVQTGNPWVKGAENSWKGLKMISENVSSSGGTVEFNIACGDEPSCNICQGVERVRVTWRFDRDISVLKPGDKFGATLDAHMITASPNCNGALSARTYLDMLGSNGKPLPGMQALPGVAPKAVDGGRFTSIKADRVTPDPNGPNTTSNAVIEVDSREPSPDCTTGYFFVQVTGPGGAIAYVYYYERATGTGNQVLGGVDLMRYCRELYGGSASVRTVANTAFGWRCVVGPQLRSLSVEDACRRQYGNPGAVARYRNFNDPNTWECVNP